MRPTCHRARVMLACQLGAVAPLGGYAIFRQRQTGTGGMRQTCTPSD